MGVKLARLRGLLGVAAVVGLAGTAFGQVSSTFLTVSATNSEGTASFDVDTSDATYNAGVYTWNGAGALMDGATQVANLNNTSVTVNTNFNAIFVNFNVDAGLSDTVFTITSATLATPLVLPEGTASGGINVTDQNSGFGGGVLATGNNVNSEIYLAQYNGSTEFLSGIASVANDTGVLTGSDSISSGGFLPIGAPISDISVEYSFVLSAEDNATGNGVFAVQGIPEPATLALLALGGLAAFRRRG